LLLGWFRAVAIVGLIPGVCITYVGFDVGDGLIPLAITVGILGALIGSYKIFGTASYEKAKVIGRHLGLNKSGMMLIEVAYGRMSPESLEAEAEQGDDEYDNPQDYDEAQDYDEGQDYDEAQGYDEEEDEKNPYQNF
jgi:hypothetical protein